MNLKRIAMGFAVSGVVAATVAMGGAQASAQEVEDDQVLYRCVFPYYGFIYFVQNSPHNPGACGPGAPIMLNANPSYAGNPPSDTGSSLSGFGSS